MTNNLKTHFYNIGRNCITATDKSDISVEFDTDDSVDVRMRDSQIQVELNQAAADKPYLPCKFIQEVLLAEADVNDGLYKP